MGGPGESRPVVLTGVSGGGWPVGISADPSAAFQPRHGAALTETCPRRRRRSLGHPIRMSTLLVCGRYSDAPRVGSLHNGGPESPEPKTPDLELLGTLLADTDRIGQQVRHLY